MSFTNVQKAPTKVLRKGRGWHGSSVGSSDPRTEKRANSKRGEAKKRPNKTKKIVLVPSPRVGVCKKELISEEIVVD